MIKNEFRGIAQIKEGEGEMVQRKLGNMGEE